MLHGFAYGIAFWAMTVEEIAAQRPLYAMDLLGFGRSSRPEFSTNAAVIEKQFVDSIEKWRKVMKIDKMILLGHSFGGFLASSYALRFPERVEHLILADPWGFESKPENYRAPLLQRLKWGFFNNFSPLSLIRAAGPFGEWATGFGLSYLFYKFKALGDRNLMVRYYHQINTINPAAGEFAVLRLLDIESWPTHPICERMKNSISDELPITFLFGERSRLDKTCGPTIKEARPASYTHFETLPRTGHNLFVDRPADFNRLVNDACKISKSLIVPDPKR